jgi:hypothetical protein
VPEWYQDIYRYENGFNDLFDSKNQKLDGTKVYAEHGEEGVLKHIFESIGVDSKFCVEIGARDGVNCSNIRWLIEQGWTGVGFESHRGYPEYAPEVKIAKVSPDNVNDLFFKNNVPENLDFLTIDIDYNDFWVLKAVLEGNEFKPSLICAEFNPNFGPTEAKSVPYCDAGKKHKSILYGASLAAFVKLCKEYDYKFIHSMRSRPIGRPDYKAGRNAFFLRSHFLPSGFDLPVEMMHPRGWDEPGKRKERKGKKFSRQLKEGSVKGIYKISQFVDV